MIEDFAQYAAHLSLVGFAAWFVTPVLVASALCYWILDLGSESFKYQAIFMSKALAAFAVGVWFLMGVYASSELRAPSADELARVARLGASTKQDAAEVVIHLRENGVGERGATGYWQLPNEEDIGNGRDAKRAKVHAAIDSTAPDSASPSHEQLCEIMRLLLGTKDAEPDGHCVLPEHAGALASAVSEKKESS